MLALDQAGDPDAHVEGTRTDHRVLPANAHGRVNSRNVGQRQHSRRREHRHHLSGVDHEALVPENICVITLDGSGSEREEIDRNTDQDPMTLVRRSRL